MSGEARKRSVINIETVRWARFACPTHCCLFTLLNGDADVDQPVLGTQAVSLGEVVDLDDGHG